MKPKFRIYQLYINSKFNLIVPQNLDAVLVMCVYATISKTHLGSDIVIHDSYDTVECKSIRGFIQKIK